jgi:soluble lytic murein transglycosylase
MGLAEAYLDMGDTQAAIETYRAFAEASPGQRRAPEALWNAARHLEYAGDLAGSAEAYLDCHARYPNAEYGDVALFRSGVLSYGLDGFVDAAAAWDTLAAQYPESSYRPAALLWLGKLRLNEGDPDGAEAALAEAAGADPDGYYGLRAASLRKDPLSRPYSSALGYDPISGTLPAQAEAEEWLRGWLGLDAGTGLADPIPELASDQRLQRGLELWHLGRLQEAKAELEALRSATGTDALAQYQLALMFRDLGLYRSSILCAVRVVSLSPSTTTLEVPAFIGRLAYPDYYRDLVVEHAEEYGLDPLLVFAQIRQESLFESLATSTASAQGLMQVIPPTGEQIAAELGWPPDYETDDLYRPYVSVRFGTYYLAQQRDRFNGRLDAALAAYNGGWFNVERWIEGTGDDPDLLLQRITFGETRLYLRRILEHYAIYQALHGSEG